MPREWGVDQLTCLGRVFEVLALADANLVIVSERVLELDDWSEDLPSDELQVVRELVARFEPLREDIRDLTFTIGHHIHRATYICDERYQPEVSFNGSPAVMTIPGQFNKKHLKEYLSQLQTTLEKAECLAFELLRSARALVKAKFPDYEVPGDDTATGYTYGDGHLMCIQHVDDGGECGELCETAQTFACYCEEDTSNLKHLRRFVEEIDNDLLNGASVQADATVPESDADNSVKMLPAV